MYFFQTQAEGISATKIKLNGEIIIVPMGHCTVTTNTTDLHGQTEVKFQLADISNNNMHLK